MKYLILLILLVACAPIEQPIEVTPKPQIETSKPDHLEPIVEKHEKIIEPEIYNPPKVIEKPKNLLLPYSIKELDLERGGAHPYGVYRFEWETQPHPGIDLMPEEGATIKAMSDGKIVYMVEDERFPGYSIIRLQVENTKWAIEYEPLVAIVQLGDIVKVGQKLGTFEDGYQKNPGLIHIDLRYYPGKFDGFHGESLCWIDHLETPLKNELNSQWDAARDLDIFKRNWENEQADGVYFLRGLFPEMCYPWGTDARE